MNRSNPEYKKRKKAFLAKYEEWGGWWTCWCGCGGKTQQPELDHIDRTGMGGSPERLLDESNWQILTRACHDKKDGGFKLKEVS